jgi:cobalamin-dependent methionine synthase I
MLIIGEKINGTRQKVGTAVLARDADFIKELAVKQVEAGAVILDVNAGTPVEREPEDLVWLVDTVQEAVDVQLCLDSPNPRALAAAISRVKRTPMLNSISGERHRIEGVLPLVREHGCPVVALALDDAGIPKTVEERLAIVRRLIGETRKAEVPDGNLYIDTLVLPVATQQDAGMTAFEAMRAVKTEFPEVHLTVGLSNISFGLPDRHLINRVFLALAMAAGLDSAIADPTERELMREMLAAELVLGHDAFCRRYTTAYRKGRYGFVPKPTN